MEEGDGGLFRGLRFRLEGFREDIEDKYRTLITNEGGTIVKKYDWKDLYFITSSEKIQYSDQICLDAREKGALLVANEFWLQDTLKNRSFADSNKALYRPPKSLDSIKGAAYLLIAHSGFKSEQSLYIERLIDMLGANHATKDQLPSCSYLICNKAEGTDFEEAVARRIFTVNDKWIEDCITEWEIMSVDNYATRPKKAQRRYRTPSKEETDDDNISSEAWSTGKKRNAQFGESSRGSPKSRNVAKRYASSAGCSKPYPPARKYATSCRRSLDFNWKFLSDFKGTELVVIVQIPSSSLERKLGTDVIKEALLRSYTELSNIHRGGQCIRNTFTAETIRVSRNTDEATFEDAQLVQFDEGLANANKDQFVLTVRTLFKDKGCSVPKDIGCWLSCIVARVPDRVLKRHVNMLDGAGVFQSFVSMFYAILRTKIKDETKYLQIVTSVDLKSYWNWKKDKFIWSTFTACLDYIHPKKLELRNLELRCGVAQSSCDPKKRDCHVFGLLEVIRDCFFHPAMDYQLQLLPILMTQFPDLLSDVQKTLSTLGILE